MLVETSPEANPTLRWTGIRRLLGIHELGVFIPIIGLAVIFAWSNPGFLTEITLESIVRASAYIGIVAVGETLLMLSGELDLSVGSVAGLGATVGAVLMTTGHLPVPLAIVLGIGVGAAAGLVNGLVTVKAGIPAVIATLGMLFIARGLNFVISQGNPIYPLPADFVRVGGEDAFGHLVGVRRLHRPRDRLRHRDALHDHRQSDRRDRRQPSRRPSCGDPHRSRQDRLLRVRGFTGGRQRHPARRPHWHGGPADRQRLGARRHRGGRHRRRQLVRRCRDRPRHAPGRADRSSRCGRVSCSWASTSIGPMSPSG